MKNRTQIGAIVIGVIIFAMCSCQKDTITNSISGNRIYLAKYVAFETPNESAIPDVTKEYHYDNLGRLQSVVTDLLHPPPQAVISYPDSLIYYYSQVDTLPYKAIHYNQGRLSPIEDYTYDKHARLTQKRYRAVSDEEGFYEFYSYSKNQIIITNSSDGNIDTLTYDGSNITQDGRWFNIQISGLKNPFYQVNVNRHIPYNPSVLGERSLNENAPLQVTAYGSYIMRYQYDSIVNGLPGKATTTINSATFVTMYFYYKQ
ncbi:hypothetical protein WSM22_40140 [Cytophagales bacterium WSM2-2]|nr:hypothetical protein WSM22_40140 [Cytophagales bacterium WSM2-2]